ncbi:Peroxyureidoacrylate/ureidoacrylate amidohydrolase RutB [Naviculisporaceae sp. PSN 640]
MTTPQETKAATNTTAKVIGGPSNFWLWTPSSSDSPTNPDGIFDLTHPPTPTSPKIYPRIHLNTTKHPAIIDPKKTALVVVDLQNYFLSPLIGRPRDSPGLRVVSRLVSTVIPAFRKASIPVLWLGWGLSDDKDDVDSMPPAIARGYEFCLDSNFADGRARDLGKLGESMEIVKLPDGGELDPGRVMMANQWNTAWYPSLVDASDRSTDMWVNKNRLSGFWGGTGVEDLLHERGIRTLLFAGVNTDQCVAASMQDAYAKGWDVLLLSDGVSTSSPDFATKCIEYNCENGWGFVLTCAQLAEGIENMQIEKED